MITDNHKCDNDSDNNNSLIITATALTVCDVLNQIVIFAIMIVAVVVTRDYHSTSLYCLWK